MGAALVSALRLGDAIVTSHVYEVYTRNVATPLLQ